MTKTGSLALPPSRSLVDRLLSILAPILDLSGEIAARNGDLAYFGL